MKNINPYYFLISLAVGMFLVYVTTPPPEVIIEYPTPENAGKVIYKEDNNLGCYTYMAKKVSCPINDEDIAKIPYQSYKNKEKNDEHPFKQIYNILGNNK
jgi:hypothetical protein